MSLRLTTLFSAIAAVSLLYGSPCLAGAPPVAPYEAERASMAPTPLDKIVEAKLAEKGIEPAHLCSDEVFVRRVYIDVIGTLPETAEVRTFLQDKSPTKRRDLIEKLLTQPEFADFWTMKWCDLLRVKSEFPINLWPNAVQAYHRWIYDAVRSNMPYDQFARELLTSSGSNFRAGQVNFYRAVQGREPAAIADAAALTFMGVRTSTWPEAQRKGFSAFFSRVAYKPTGEWKEEIVCHDPNSTMPVIALFPDGKTIRLSPEEDPRIAFADWLLSPGNAWFARNLANRSWAWLLGRGVIHEADDIRPNNPPSNPELLAYLEKEVVAGKYDPRHLFRLILNSRTYQQSSIPQSKSPEGEALFASYMMRRNDAEVLMDAISWLTETEQGYSSPIPEPFTFVPEHQRSVKLADGSITSPFLELFGRPSRDTGLESERSSEPSDAQLRHLLNSADIQRRITRSQRIQRALRNSRGNQDDLIGVIYMGIMSRPPTEAERATAKKYVKTGTAQKSGTEDLVWALINTKEFLYRH